MKITVNVLDTHIDAPCNPESVRAHHCAVAQALVDAGYTDVSVGRYSMFIHANGKDYEANTPPEARKFIEAYDKWDFDYKRKDPSLKPQPVSFEAEFRAY